MSSRGGGFAVGDGTWGAGSAAGGRGCVLLRWVVVMFELREGVSTSALRCDGGRESGGHLPDGAAVRFHVLEEELETSQFRRWSCVEEALGCRFSFVGRGNSEVRLRLAKPVLRAEKGGGVVTEDSEGGLRGEGEKH